MSVPEEVIAAFAALFESDSELGNYIGAHTWDDGTRTRAAFFGQAPTGASGCYAVVRAEENPHEDYGRKRLWYAVDVFDEGQSGAKAIRACRRFEKLITTARPALSGGHFIRAYLDAGPSQVPEAEGQHWSMDFVVEYSDDSIITAEGS